MSEMYRLVIARCPTERYNWNSNMQYLHRSMQHSICCIFGGLRHSLSGIGAHYTSWIIYVTHPCLILVKNDLWWRSTQFWDWRNIGYCVLKSNTAAVAAAPLCPILWHLWHCTNFARHSPGLCSSDCAPVDRRPGCPIPWLHLRGTMLDSFPLHPCTI